MIKICYLFLYSRACVIAQAIFLRSCLNFFRILHVENQVYQWNMQKIIVSIFLTMEATILDTHGRFLTLKTNFVFNENAFFLSSDQIWELRYYCYCLHWQLSNFYCSEKGLSRDLAFWWLLPKVTFAIQIKSKRFFSTISILIKMALMIPKKQAYLKFCNLLELFDIKNR